MSGAIDPTARILRRRRRVARRRTLRAHRSSCAAAAHRAPIGRGLAGMFALGIRHTSVRPARSVLSLALIAFASFVLVSVGAFKKDVSASSNDLAFGHRRLHADGRIGRAADARSQHAARAATASASRPAIRSWRTRPITRFRLRPGDETSCLTLYRPTNPRIIAPEPRFFTQPRFSFASSMATTAEEIANPWLLLNRRLMMAPIAAIADQTTLMYVAASGGRRRFHVHA